MSLGYNFIIRYMGGGGDVIVLSSLDFIITLVTCFTTSWVKCNTPYCRSQPTFVAGDILGGHDAPSGTCKS